MTNLITPNWTIEHILSLIDQMRLFLLAKALILLFFGFWFGKYLSKFPARFMHEHFSPHQINLSQRLIFYIVFILFFLMSMQQLGFSISIFLGATGIVTLALTFASQTSAANLISGLFLIFEKPFQIGETININNIIGEVFAIDLLSIKLKTPDNQFVRIPNETLIKSNIINLSRFDTKRLDLKLNFSLTEDIAKTEKILLEILKLEPLCLQNPEPSLNFSNFNDYSITLELWVWTTKENFQILKNKLPLQILETLKRENIHIPYPTQEVQLKNYS